MLIASGYLRHKVSLYITERFSPEHAPFYSYHTEKDNDLHSQHRHPSVD